VLNFFTGNSPLYFFVSADFRNVLKSQCRGYTVYNTTEYINVIKTLIAIEKGK
jgi:hypothetical protein